MDIQQADEAFRNQNDTRMESRSCGEKPFNRWAWWMSERGGWTSAPKASSWWTASEAWRSARTQTSSVSMSSTASASQPWQYVGPEGVPTHGGAGRINRLKVDPMDANHWYACAPSGGLWQTHDSGSNWEVVGVDILSPLGATDLWIDPKMPNTCGWRQGMEMEETHTALGFWKVGTMVNLGFPLSCLSRAAWSGKFNALLHTQRARDFSLSPRTWGFSKPTTEGVPLIWCCQARRVIWCG